MSPGFPIHIERRQHSASDGASDAKRRELAMRIDATHLEADLRASVDGEVRFDPGSRALYATAGSNYRQVPIGVVIPRTLDDVLNAVAVARRHSAPILARGGGTSLAGQCCNVAVVLDCSKYLHRVMDLDPHRRCATVQPGVVLDDLRAAAERYRLTYGPDPSTHSHCTLGGMIGNNSCGVHSVMAGQTSDNVEHLDVLTYDGLRLTVGKTPEADLDRAIEDGGRRGEIYRRLKALRDRYGDVIRRRFPDIPRRVSGYNLPALLPENGFDVAKALVGSESTCVLVLGATVRLVYSPPVRSLLVLGYPDVYRAADHIDEVLAAKPIGLEGMDDVLVDDMIKMRIHPQDVKLLPEGGGWLLVEFGGDSKEEADDQARGLMEALRAAGSAPSMKLFDDPAQERVIWTVRESGLGATAHVPGGRATWEGWEDSSVPVEHLGKYLRALRALFDKYGYACALYGHFGQGCVHTRIDFDLKTHAGIAKFRSFLFEAADLVVSFGGSLSGEHGDGQSRAELLPKMFGPELIRAFEEFKAIWDPDWRMNPGKIVRPYRLDENLRLGADYRPPDLSTHFAFSSDGFNFADATIRCVGVGECRRETGKTMCPSYRVTREEMHSTRGRARLLFEMLEGHPLSGGWRDAHVKESLDLCLACKGCKGDCPVNVDLATYKAEFLSHYYAGRLRPRHAYSMGLIYWWARLASVAPAAANFLTQTPGLASVMKLLGGIAQERRMPKFAPLTFTEWFRRRTKRGHGARRVILWPDTFNNYFLPHTAKAAAEVLEALGWHVSIPRRPLCCGRPLYDFGMLETAKRLLRQILRELRDDIVAGTPVIGLEPSCVAVFKDELINLFPHDEDARRLSQQTVTFAEFLKDGPVDRPWPRLGGKAIVHGHCHQKALIGMTAEEAVLSRLGVESTTLDSGCCGMAGSFGFIPQHWETSMQIGELVLLPAVRKAGQDDFIIADGFSCREQIAQATDRRGLHLAEIVHLAFQHQTGAFSNGEGRTPERSYLDRNRLEPNGRRGGAPFMIFLLAGAGLWLWYRRSSRAGSRRRSAGRVPR